MQDLTVLSDQRKFARMELDQRFAFLEVIRVLVLCGDRFPAVTVQIPVFETLASYLLREQRASFMKGVQIVVSSSRYWLSLLVNQKIALAVARDGAPFFKGADKRVNGLKHFFACPLIKPLRSLSLDNGETVILKILGIVIAGLNDRAAIVADIAPQLPLLQIERRRMERGGAQAVFVFIIAVID